MWVPHWIVQQHSNRFYSFLHFFCPINFSVTNFLVSWLPDKQLQLLRYAQICFVLNITFMLTNWHLTTKIMITFTNVRTLLYFISTLFSLGQESLKNFYLCGNCTYIPKSILDIQYWFQNSLSLNITVGKMTWWVSCTCYRLCDNTIFRLFASFYVIWLQWNKSVQNKIQYINFTLFV